MTYEGVKHEYKVENYPRHLSDNDFLKYVNGEMLSKGLSWFENIIQLQEVSVLTNDFVGALNQAGFPQDKIVVINDKKVKIELGGKWYILSSTAAFHTYLYEDDKIDNAIDIFHIPADLMATYLVGQYYLESVREKELHYILDQYKVYQAWADKSDELKTAVHIIEKCIHTAIKQGQDYQHLKSNYQNAMMAYVKHLNPKYTEDNVKGKTETCWKEKTSEYLNEFEIIQSEKKCTMVVCFKQKPNNFETISYEDSLEHPYYKSRTDIDDFIDDLYSAEAPIKIYLKPSEQRHIYHINSLESGIKLSDGRIFVLYYYEPDSPYEETWPELGVIIFDNQDEMDKYYDQESNDNAIDDIHKEPLEPCEIPIEILTELVSLQKAEVMSIQEFEEAFNKSKEQFQNSSDEDDMGEDYMMVLK